MRRERGFPGHSSPERAALLESLRRRIAQGEYRVPTEQVADAVLRAWARPGPGGAGPGAGGGGAGGRSQAG
jgi:hypothetical protein